MQQTQFTRLLLFFSLFKAQFMHYVRIVTEKCILFSKFNKLNNSSSSNKLTFNINTLFTLQYAIWQCDKNEMQTQSSKEKETNTRVVVFVWSEQKSNMKMSVLCHYMKWFMVYGMVRNISANVFWPVEPNFSRLKRVAKKEKKRIQFNHGTFELTQLATAICNDGRLNPNAINSRCINRMYGCWYGNAPLNIEFINFTIKQSCWIEHSETKTTIESHICFYDLVHISNVLGVAVLFSCVCALFLLAHNFWRWRKIKEANGWCVAKQWSIHFVFLYAYTAQIYRERELQRKTANE